jgi:hypothetical protein
MSSFPLITLKPEQYVTELVNYLQHYPTLSDFPIVDPNRGGILMGVITRDDLHIILSYKDLFYEPDEFESKSSPSSEQGQPPGNEINPATEHPKPEGTKRKKRRKALKFEELVRQRYRDIPSIDRILEVIKQDGDYSEGKVIDLTPYLEIGHYTINRMVSFERAFELFRTLGLCELVVTDSKGVPVGMITSCEKVGVDEVRLAQKKNNIGFYEIN